MAGRGEDALVALREAMAERTGTRAADWFLTFKCRHGMQVVLREAAAQLARREVVTQLFTCVTAVDPIVAEGLTPVYVDISQDSLAVDPALIELGPSALAVVAQHTFGIIDAARTEQLRAQAHGAGALLLEDCAHCLCRMARNAEGTPLADVSFHSFGVEKMLPGVYFGGAVWVNPSLADKALRERLCAALAALPPLEKKLDRAARAYRNQMRVFTRIPHGISVASRGLLASVGSFEPAVSDEECRGKVSHQPSLPSPWVAEQALGALKGLAANEANRRACVAAYLEGFGADAAGLTFAADAFDVAHDQPLLRFPVFFASTERATKAIEAVAALGHYAQSWPRPLLLPGVLDAQAYGLEQGMGAAPVSERLSAGVVGLPTDIDPAAVPEVVRVVRACC